MLSYETAVKLEKLGFPVGNSILGISSKGIIVKQDFDYGWITLEKPNLIQWGGEHIAYLPTLSELIDKCGEERPDSDGEDTRFCLWFDGKNWQAGYYFYGLGGQDYIDASFDPQASGSSPEEAVAALYLAIHKH